MTLTSDLESNGHILFPKLYFVDVLFKQLPNRPIVHQRFCTITLDFFSVVCYVGPHAVCNTLTCSKAEILDFPKLKRFINLTKPMKPYVDNNDTAHSRCHCKMQLILHYKY